MRRWSPDYSYKSWTGDIISRHFDTWQLSYKDSREGIHRFINKIVSLGEEIERESDYVESMFFPDAMDLSEEWVLFTPHPPISSDDVYISGTEIDSVIRRVTDVDDLIGGQFDGIEYITHFSGLPEASIIVAEDITTVYSYQSGILYDLDLVEGSVSGSGILERRDYGFVEATFDRHNRVCTIEDDYVADTFEMRRIPLHEEDSTVTISGNVYTVTPAGDLTGTWNPEFDMDGNRYIGDREHSEVRRIYGLTMADLGPDEWTKVAWADIDSDGVISEKDYNAVRSAVPSAHPDVTAVITVPDTLTGRFGILYQKDSTRTIAVCRQGTGYGQMKSDSALLDMGVAFTYDSHTNVYYAIDSEQLNLRALKYDEINNFVTGDAYIYSPRWSAECKLIDLDTCNGFLFVLMSDGNTHRVVYGDIWSEYVDSISIELDLSLPAGFVPDHMTTTPNGYIIFQDGTEYLLCKPYRDAFMDVDGQLYLNRDRTLTVNSGEISLIPSYVFNSFDSFAYSLGIERPWGCDNLQMRRLIYDFFEHPQGLDKIGAPYGIYRELGYVNQDVVPSGTPYYLPNVIDPSGDITINDAPMTVINEVGDMVTISGSIGTIDLYDGLVMYPSSGVITSYNSLTVVADAIDGHGETIETSVKISMDQGSFTHPITIATLADTEYLTEQGYYISGSPSSSFSGVVSSLESNHPLIYNNVVVNTVPFDAGRVSEEPTVLTEYDVGMSDIIDTSQEVEVTL